MIVIPFDKYKDDYQSLIDKINNDSNLNLKLPKGDIKKIIFNSILANKKNQLKIL